MVSKKIFDVTDLGEPSRIVGIEITRTEETLMISQPLYIDSILRKYEIEHVNPVSYDPHLSIQTTNSNLIKKFVSQIKATTTHHS